MFGEALALGLDRNDEIIKRRLAQKMDFLAADVAAMQEPGNAELRQCFPTNSGRFAVPPRASLLHLYFLASLLANLLILQSGGRPFYAARLLPRQHSRPNGQTSSRCTAANPV
ncbi:MAG: hypothetical protein E5W40_22065 [Mesorhizobium sp.]|nr:MAG: hypothetical protein E5W40_22065 [Mesorhizobium sp.]